MVCSNCSAVLPEEARFCWQCGTRQSPAPESPEPEPAGPPAPGDAHQLAGLVTAVFQASPEAMVLSDRQGLVLAANPAYYQLYGYAPEEVLGHDFAIIFPEEKRAWAAEQYQRVFHGLEPRLVFETTVVRRDGTTRLVEARVEFLHQDHQRTAMLSIVRDITEQKAAEAALRRSEARFATLFARSPYPIILTRLADRQIVAVNASWCWLTGYTREEVLGQTPTSLGLWIDPPMHDHMIEQLGEQHVAPAVEYQLRGKSGAVRDMLGTPEPVEIDGEPCILEAALDITERKRMEETLRTREQYFRSVFDRTLDAIVIFDDQGRYCDVNAAACALYSLPRAALLQHRLGDFVVPDAAQTQDTWQRFISAGQLRGELVVRAANGLLRHVDVHAIANFLPGRHLSVERDITLRKEMEERALAAERLGALGRVAAGVVHEFNNALAGIVGRLDLLALQVQDASLLAEIQRIQEAADDATAMIQRVRGFSRLHAEHTRAWVPVADLLARVVAFTQPLWQTAAQQKGAVITVTTEVEPDLQVWGNATELREVLTNLTINAVDALAQGGAIRLRALRQGPLVVLIVADTGSGMDAAIQEQIFEPFFSTKPSGTGLGLAVVRDIVQAHGGTVLVSSQLGAGTTFTVTLPAAPVGI